MGTSLPEKHILLTKYLKERIMRRTNSILLMALSGVLIFVSCGSQTVPDINVETPQTLSTPDLDSSSNRLNLSSNQEPVIIKKQETPVSLKSSEPIDVSKPVQTHVLDIKPTPFAERDNSEKILSQGEPIVKSTVQIVAEEQVTQIIDVESKPVVEVVSDEISSLENTDSAPLSLDVTSKTDIVSQTVEESSIPVEENSPKEEPVARKTTSVEENNTVAESFFAVAENTEIAKPVPITSKFGWEEYMIIPGDYLFRIAKKEYGDWKRWRDIYEWNRKEIGDNPNLIYPYHFLDMKKPIDEVENAEPTFTEYTVKEGDNLWTIAGKTYGDEKSWIIVYWDNEEIIDANDGILYPGMTIKLRRKLDPRS